jgi:hypothetical protein
MPGVGVRWLPRTVQEYTEQGDRLEYGKYRPALGRVLRSRLRHSFQILLVFRGNQLLERILQRANGPIQCPQLVSELADRLLNIHMNQSAASVFKT